MPLVATVSSELARLLTIENYNGLDLRISQYTHDTATEYLTIAPEIKPEITPTGDAGVDIEWELNERKLIVSCYSDGKATICWREAGGRYEGQSASIELLQERLKWLKGDLS